MSAGGDDYDDDFEDYHEPSDQETINQKCKILSNMEALERSKGRPADMDDSISQISQVVGLCLIGLSLHLCLGCTCLAYFFNGKGFCWIQGTCN